MDTWKLWLFVFWRGLEIKWRQILGWSNIIISRQTAKLRRPKHKSAHLISQKNNITTFSFNWDNFHDTDIADKIICSMIDNARSNISIHFNCIMINNCNMFAMISILKRMIWFYYCSLWMRVLYRMNVMAIFRLNLHFI